MLNRSLFKKPNVQLEGDATETVVAAAAQGAGEELMRACPACKQAHFMRDLQEGCFVCGACGHHLRLSARQRIDMLVDAGSFVEMDAEWTSKNLIGFPDYEEKLQKAREVSGENEAVTTGTAAFGGHACALFVMNSHFMMGSMGTVVGDKITRIFEYATAQRMPVVGFTVSGGARMQEGILSLMQMAKTSAAVYRHSQAGLFYLTILTDPTTGGVTASFAMEGDIILAEPNALIGFAGPRVIEQTIHQKLPEGFQRAELLLEKGFVDGIVDRREQAETIAMLLRLHEGGRAHAGV